MLSTDLAWDIRTRISRGELAPGAKLSEVAVASHYGVSRNTLREAFSTLAQEKIVRREANRGVFVARPSAEDVMDVYRARMSVEPASLFQSSSEHIARLRTIVENAEKAREAGDGTAIAAANQDFHQAIVAAAGSRALNGFMHQLLALMRLAFLLAQEHDPNFHHRFIKANDEVVRLLEKGEIQAAAELLSQQLDRTSVALAATLGQQD